MTDDPTTYETPPLWGEEWFAEVNAAWSLARKTAWPICDTSKSPAWRRVCRCSLRMPSGYCRGMA